MTGVSDLRAALQEIVDRIESETGLTEDKTITEVHLIALRSLTEDAEDEVPGAPVPTAREYVESTGLKYPGDPV